MKQLPYRRIAVLGAAGQLGGYLTRELGVAAIPLVRSQVDITQQDSVRQLEESEPDLVINCAAYTAVDRAETETGRCYEVNEAAVRRLAELCQRLNVPLVQISTDYVFGGDRDRREPYSHQCPPSPVNVYGQSKLAGELAMAHCEKHFIIRTCGLYLPGDRGPVKGRNFVDTMLALAQNNRVLRVVADQTCTPTYVPHFVQMVAEILRHDQPGTYHATNIGETNWFDFASELFRQAACDVAVEPISSADYGALAPRPHYSVLLPSLVDASGLLPPWQDGIAGYLFDRNWR